MKYERLVRNLTTHCSGWIFGSAANLDINNPRDFDIFIPIEYWSKACSYIPLDSKINRSGGYKCLDNGIEVDVWTGNMNDMLSTVYFSYAYHPNSGVRIKLTK